MAKSKIVIHTKTYKDGTSPVMLRVTHNRKTKYFGTNVSCEHDQWNQDKSELRKNFRDYLKKNKLLRKLSSRAEDIIDDFEKEAKPFTFNSFESLYRMNSSKMSFKEFVSQIIESLRDTHEVNTANTYSQMLNAVLAFSGTRDLMFQDIDYQFLKKFESFLFLRGSSGGGVHFYMRMLRAAYNKAISAQIVKEQLYPFSRQGNKNGYSLSSLKSQASPRALSESDMQKLKDFKYGQFPEFRDSYLYFMFSYYSRGINFSDIARLQESDLYDGRISYFRSKTNKLFSIAISDPMNEIISQFRDRMTGGYVFPILQIEKHQTETQIRYRIQKCLKKVNSDLKKIAEILGIKVSLTTYVARHTYASTLKRMNVNVAKISQALGHADISTTRAYLDNFDHSVIDETDKYL